MKGTVLTFDRNNSSGMISGHDGNRYHYVLLEWKNKTKPIKGQIVDFETDDNNAKNIILLSNANAGKSRLAAALLAFFLGGFGVHKFYLGRIGWGFIYLIFCWTAIPAIIAFIETFIYLLMSDEKFNEKYNSQN